MESGETGYGEIIQRERPGMERTQRERDRRERERNQKIGYRKGKAR